MGTLLRMGDTTPQHPDHARLFVTASEQFGYFTASQAQAAGFGRDLLTHHTRSGRFLRIRRGLYRLRDYPISPHEDVMAACLALGRDVPAVSHETALQLLGLTDARTDAIHISVPRSKRHLPKLPGVIIHTMARALTEDDTVMVDGMRVTSPPRSIVDVADAGIAPSAVEFAVAHAIERGLIAAEGLARLGAERGQRVTGLITRAAGSQPATGGGDDGQKASSLGGRRGRSGYRYQDFVVAEWYAKLLHSETTRVASVQNETRGTVDDIRVTFTSGTYRYQQVKEKRRLSSQDKL